LEAKESKSGQGLTVEGEGHALLAGKGRKRMGEKTADPLTGLESNRKKTDMTTGRKRVWT